MNNDNISLSSDNLANNLLKSCDWLNDLLELHYFAYNSCNSLTIYSYKYWSSQKKLLVSTKENNIKEIYFDLVINEETVNNTNEQVASTNADNILLSMRSSLSSGNSNSNTRHASVNNEEHTSNKIRKSSIEDSEAKSNMFLIDSDESYLEPVYKIHKLPKVKGI